MSVSIVSSSRARGAFVLAGKALVAIFKVMARDKTMMWRDRTAGHVLP